MFNKTRLFGVKLSLWFATSEKQHQLTEMDEEETKEFCELPRAVLPSLTEPSVLLRPSEWFVVGLCWVWPPAPQCTSFQTSQHPLAFKMCSGAWEALEENLHWCLWSTLLAKIFSYPPCLHDLFTCWEDLNHAGNQQKRCISRADMEDFHRDWWGMSSCDISIFCVSTIQVLPLHICRVCLWNCW